MTAGRLGIFYWQKYQFPTGGTSESLAGSRDLPGSYEIRNVEGSHIIARVSILIILCATWIQAQVHDNQTPDIQQLKDKLQQLEQEMQQLKAQINAATTQPLSWLLRRCCWASQLRLCSLAC